MTTRGAAFQGIHYSAERSIWCFRPMQPEGGFLRQSCRVCLDSHRVDEWTPRSAVGAPTWSEESLCDMLWPKHIVSRSNLCHFHAEALRARVRFTAFFLSTVMEAILSNWLLPHPRSWIENEAVQSCQSNLHACVVRYHAWDYLILWHNLVVRAGSSWRPWEKICSMCLS